MEELLKSKDVVCECLIELLGLSKVCCCGWWYDGARCVLLLSSHACSHRSTLDVGEFKLKLFTLCLADRLDCEPYILLERLKLLLGMLELWDILWDARLKDEVALDLLKLLFRAPFELLLWRSPLLPSEIESMFKSERLVGMKSFLGRFMASDFLVKNVLQLVSAHSLSLFTHFSYSLLVSSDMMSAHD